MNLGNTRALATHSLLPPVGRFCGAVRTSAWLCQRRCWLRERMKRLCRVRWLIGHSCKACLIELAKVLCKKRLVHADSNFLHVSVSANKQTRVNYYYFLFFRYTVYGFSSEFSFAVTLKMCMAFFACPWKSFVPSYSLFSKFSAVIEHHSLIQGVHEWILNIAFQSKTTVIRRSCSTPAPLAQCRHEVRARC